MLYRRLRRRQVRPSYYFRPLSRGKRILLFIFLIIILLFAALMLIISRLRPVITKMVNTEVTDIVTLEINNAVQKELATGDYGYDKLVTLEKDGKGNITALITNIALINKLQAQITNEVTRAVENELSTSLKVPIGNAIGGVIFSDRGPYVPIKILSIPDASTNYMNSFTSAGINQTRHRILLEVCVDIDIYVPGATSKSTVKTEVPIAETVIVGTVPNVYANMGDTGES